MKKFMSLFVVVFLLIFLTSCFYRKPIEIIVSNTKIKLNNEFTTIIPKEPLILKRDKNYVGLLLSEKWILKDVEKGQIKLNKSGKIITIKAKLTDQNGNIYKPLGYCMKGGKFSFGYPFKKGVKIVKIEISSSEEIFCNEIVWHCYDPI